MSLLGVLCVSGTGLCVGPITCPEESYRACCVHLSVVAKPRYSGGPGPGGDDAPRKILHITSISERKNNSETPTHIYVKYTEMVPAEIVKEL
jgi:hypothetical protein